MTTTSLARILNDMDFYQDISRVETVFKVRALDDALRRFRRTVQAPWSLQQGTLRVFDGVVLYPTASDHDEIGFFDRTTGEYARKPDFRFTSMKEFFEDKTSRNDLSEIWDGGTKMLGIRYKNNNLGSQTLNVAETASEWTASGTASSPTLDQVTFKEGNGSIKFTVTAGTATMKNTLPSTSSDSNHKKKYQFKWIYLDAVPTSVSLRHHIDASNYIETTGITTQFSGQAMKADAWNLFAHDQNTATETGTIGSSPTFTYEEFDLVGASAGTYFVDTSYLREWTLLDYWYYSKFYVETISSTGADQEYFMNSSEVYSTDSDLIGESEFVDVIKYEAMVSVMGNIQNKFIKDEIERKRNDAWQSLFDQYPSLAPSITTSYYDFSDSPQEQYHGYANYWN